jgi:effector-binding domain-containing protein
MALRERNVVSTERKGKVLRCWYSQDAEERQTAISRLIGAAENRDFRISSACLGCTELLHR